MSYPLLNSFKGELHLQHCKNPTLAKEIQTLLIIGGFLDSAADGQIGTDTLAAFADFKRAAYLAHPDLLGTTTAQALLELKGLAIHQHVVDQLLPTSEGKILRLPGGEPVNTIKSIIPGCKNFVWGEATAQGARVPQSKSVVAGIIKIAQYLEGIRQYLGDRSITVNSWYRPARVNAQVGGVSNSTHLLGHAVDFVVDGIPPLEVYRLLNSWHGSRGGLGRSSQFTHLDLRGYQARWQYGR